MLLMLDNYDSFTWNVVQYLRELGETVEVYRNDKITLQEIEKLKPEKLVISPGPCAPDQAGISIRLVEHFQERIPILGICLGHQVIAQVYGGTIIRAKRVVHGKTSAIYHNKLGVFRNIVSPYLAARYHSLVVDNKTLPECLELTAWTQTEKGSLEEIMGIRHKVYPVEGVQFHPESFISEYGHQLLDNFLKQ